MKRREFLSIIAAVGGVGWPALAQKSSRPSVVGLLSPFNDAQSTLLADLRSGLRDRGYIEGQNLKIEYKSAEGHMEQLRSMALELVRANVDIIVTSGAAGI